MLLIVLANALFIDLPITVIIDIISACFFVGSYTYSRLTD